MISTKHKFILITPPKTGGQSIINTTLGYLDIKNKSYNRNISSNYIHYSDYFGRGANHIWIEKIYKNWDKNILGNFDDYHKIGVIRNPWDRMISWWSFRNALPHIIKNNKTATLEKFLKDPHSWEHLSGLQRKNIDKVTGKEISRKIKKGDRYVIESKHWPGQDPIEPGPIYHKNLLQDYFSIDGKVIIDSYIRFENIQEDFNKICNQIGIPIKKLQHLNKSKHKHYTEHYTNELKEIISKRYKKDIEYFQYKFEEQIKNK